MPVKLIAETDNVSTLCEGMICSFVLHSTETTHPYWLYMQACGGDLLDRQGMKSWETLSPPENPDLIRGDLASPNQSFFQCGSLQAAECDVRPSPWSISWASFSTRGDPKRRKGKKKREKTCWIPADTGEPSGRDNLPARGRDVAASAPLACCSWSRSSCCCSVSLSGRHRLLPTAFHTNFANLTLHGCWASHASGRRI